MKIYMAPMEGVTGHIFRNTFEKYFGKGHIDKYFMPFITPKKDNSYTKKELADINHQNNEGICVVPQIMTSDSELFKKCMKMLSAEGYNDINLNFGCPSGTVVSRHRGAGMLEDVYYLDKFLEEAFDAATAENVKISVKTRLGIKNAEEFEEILSVYEKYPLEELIIHPRVRDDYYRNCPNLNVYNEAVERYKGNICYNGDIFTIRKYGKIINEISTPDRIMVGRGFIGNPFLIYDLCGIERPNDQIQKKQVKSFAAELFESYADDFMSDNNALQKMKEIWSHLSLYYINGEKAYKKIKKSRHKDEYVSAVNEFFISSSVMK